MTIKSDIQLFFEAPMTPTATAGNPAVDPTGAGRPCRKYGILYHLRRNAHCCFETDPSSNEIRAPWPGAMCTMAGIDLLATFHAGTNEMRRGKKQLRGVKKSDRWKYAVGTRFTQLLQNAGLSSQEATVLYAFRNTLLHSFGVFDKSKGRRFRLITETSGAPLVQTVGTNLFCINLAELHNAFENQAIKYYENLVSTAVTSDPIVSDFNRMYHDFGWMLVFATTASASSSSVGLTLPSLPSTTSPLLSGVNTGNLMTIGRSASGM